MPGLTKRSEASIQKAVVEYARSKGCIAIKQSTAGRFGTSGWPDYLIITKRGQYLWIEFKRDGGEVTPLQQQRHLELLSHGARVIVIDGVAVGKQVIDRVLR